MQAAHTWCTNEDINWQSKTHFNKAVGLDNLLLGGKQLKYFSHETLHEDGYFFLTIFESEINYFLFCTIQYGVLRYGIDHNGLQ